MPTIERQSTTLYYEVHGDGLPLLLSHGYSGTGEMWSKQVGPLSSSRRVVTWDMRGHGRSASPDDPAAYSELSSVQDMAAILDECGAAPAVVGGLALGGYLSLCIYLSYPERTRALILVGTGPGYRNAAAREGWNRNAQSIADDLDARGLAALDDVIWGRDPLHRSASGLAHSARGVLVQDDDHVFDSLPRISVPTLIALAVRPLRVGVWGGVARRAGSPPRGGVRVDGLKTLRPVGAGEGDHCGGPAVVRAPVDADPDGDEAVDRW